MMSFSTNPQSQESLKRTKITFTFNTTVAPVGGQLPNKSKQSFEKILEN